MVRRATLGAGTYCNTIRSMPLLKQPGNWLQAEWPLMCIILQAQGMKRLGADEAPEMFPATTDRLAAPVEGDDAVAATFRPLMAGTRLEHIPMRCAVLFAYLLLTGVWQLHPSHL